MKSFYDIKWKQLTAQTLFRANHFSWHEKHNKVCRYQQSCAPVLKQSTRHFRQQEGDIQETPHAAQCKGLSGKASWRSLYLSRTLNSEDKLDKVPGQAKTVGSCLLNYTFWMIYSWGWEVRLALIKESGPKIPNTHVNAEFEHARL